MRAIRTAAEIFDDVIGNIAAVVVALVEHGALLANLREEVTVETGVAAAQRCRANARRRVCRPLS